MDDTFTIQYDHGQPGVSENNAQFAQIWDGPIQVASLVNAKNVWLVNFADIDYVDSTDGEWETVQSFINAIRKSLESV